MCIPGSRHLSLEVSSRPQYPKRAHRGTPCLVRRRATSAPPSSLMLGHDPHTIVLQHQLSVDDNLPVLGIPSNKGCWRNGSAFDSRSKGYPFKSGVAQRSQDHIFEEISFSSPLDVCQVGVLISNLGGERSCLSGGQVGGLFLLSIAGGRQEVLMMMGMEPSSTRLVDFSKSVRSVLLLTGLVKLRYHTVFFYSVAFCFDSGFRPAKFFRELQIWSWMRGAIHPIPSSTTLPILNRMR